MAATDIEAPAPPERPQAQGGLVDWITTVEHKKIGILYILTALAVFLAGGVLALLVRLELTEPGLQTLSENSYNAVFTMHGTLMIFLFANQISTGFANYFVPIQIGAADVAFPRLNAMSYWMYLFGVLMVASGFLVAGGPATAGWTGYAPLSSSQFLQGNGMDLWLMGLAVVGIASIIGAINLIVTIFNLRMPGMTMFRMPLFTWGVLVAQLLVVFAFPPLTAALAMLFMERNFGAAFFDPAVGGSPILWQHIFWFFGHPEVYIVIFPAFGITSEVIPVFSRKPIFGYRALVFAFFGIAAYSFGVWAHHMFTTGLVYLPYFSLMSFLIAVPTGVKIFNWIATMWRGALRFTTAMLHAVAFLLMFTVGGITGVFLASPPIDFAVNDTYYVVAHFHYVMAMGLLFALLAGLYFWFPKMTGRYLDERLGKVGFLCIFAGSNLAFFPQFLLGLEGMPRRIANYQGHLGWDGLNRLSTLGSLLMG
ncbi:MAG: cbb3-type cytochrome c oxidase subunit I, partial [Sporichthyaceae bacterium]|nr:cbb3-type cytochrome c oxidase subunit I [Sporichthyaceae bacterium]